jgi:hypothetical protein
MISWLIIIDGPARVGRMTTEEKVAAFESSLSAFVEAFEQLELLGHGSLAQDVLAGFDEEWGSADVVKQRKAEAVESFRKWANREDLKKSAKDKLSPAELAALFGKDYSAD